MAFNTILEQKIDSAAKNWKDTHKKKMFGGVCWLIRGNMCFGIWKDFLIVRMDKALAERSLTQRNVRPFDVTGRPMAGWVMVPETGWKSPAGLARWLKIGKEFALSLPEKTAKKTAKRTKTLKEYSAHRSKGY
ncbi:MAG: TfoX/Sxy family protein [Nitrospirota bacterium]|nr:TfoX/Sxy family protein [Nitrospirota bacterium]